MPSPLRCVLPGVPYEITSRVIQGRCLLRPGPVSNPITLGVVGRAQFVYPDIELYALFVLSNHFTMLVLPQNPNRSGIVGPLTGPEPQ